MNGAKFRDIDGAMREYSVQLMRHLLDVLESSDDKASELTPFLPQQYEGFLARVRTVRENVRIGRASKESWR